ncbi:unnamed protein product [Didymodactylos carnosus]|uniref:ATP-dependent DNA helicase n=1 Tax=Didymodactylos carnosus TaxID=1234261 RepID=A0A8S2LZ51_9BILA|nr:unnamed protein product [Didymodactylos carnosus]CAF3930059.1 unnamed protein product [Didymodactylos carnosus]
MGILQNFLNQDDKTNGQQKLGKPVNPRFIFQDTHPQHDSHILVKRSINVVPVLIGSKIPRKDKEETNERYARCLLALFVPWRKVEDLCEVHQTWDQALELYKHLITSESRRIIQNIQLLHECKEDRDAHLLQVIQDSNTRQDSNIEPILTCRNVDQDEDIDDSENLLQLLDYYNNVNKLFQLNQIRKSTSVYVNQAVGAVIATKRFPNVTNKANLLNESSITPQFNHTNPNAHCTEPIVTPMTTKLAQLNKKWQQDLKRAKQKVRERILYGDADVNDIDDSSAAINLHIDLIVSHYDAQDNVSTELVRQVSVSSLKAQQEYVSKTQYCLDTEQHRAFMIITQHLEGKSHLRTNDKQDQLLMCVPGQGGTGKSQLIRAITEYFSLTKRSYLLRKVAPTSIAAAEIDALTIESLTPHTRNRYKES